MVEQDELIFPAFRVFPLSPLPWQYVGAALHPDSQFLLFVPPLSHVFIKMSGVVRIACWLLEGSLLHSGFSSLRQSEDLHSL